jgi:hypothetical protein
MRLAHIKRQFQECVNEIMRNVAWFMFHDYKVNFPLGEEGIMALGEPEPLFRATAMIGLFDDMDIDIDAMSMERVSDVVLQRRTMEMLNLIGTISQQMVVAPHVKWNEVLSMVGDALNIPNFADIIDRPKAAQMQQNAAQMPQVAVPQERNGMAQILSRNKGT